MNFRKLLTYLTVGTAAVIPFAGAQNPTILQGNYISNVFGQSNFILNPNAQTNTANVTVSNATVTRSTTTPLVATSEFLITTSTATGFADWATRTFDQGMKGQNCEARFTYRGFSVGSTTVQIRQGSNTVAQLTLTASTDPRIASINFPCGDLSAATTLRVQQATAALTGTNELSGLYLGLATNQANVAQAEYMGGFSTSSLLSTVTGTAAYWTNFTNTSGSVTAEGKALSASNTLAATFGAMPAGEYQVVVSVPFFMFGGTGGHSCRLAVKEETSGQIQVISTMGTASAGAGLYVGVSATGPAKFSFTGAATSRTFRIVAANTGWTTSANGTCYTDSSYTGNLAVYRFPTSSELVVTPERQNVWGSVKFTPSGTVVVNYSTPSNQIFNDASAYSPTTASYQGKATAQTASCGAANNLGLCIPTIPPGTYEVTADGVFDTLANVAGNGCQFEIFDGTSKGGQQEIYNAVALRDQNLGTIRGVFTYTSVQTNKPFSVRVSGNSNQCRNVAGATRPINMVFQPLDQPSNSALYVQGPVLGAQTGAAIPAGYVGEVLESTAGSDGTNLPTTNGNTFDINTLTISTPGVYLVMANFNGVDTGQTTPAYIQHYLFDSTNSVTLGVTNQPIGTGNPVSFSTTANYAQTSGSSTVYAYVKVTTSMTIKNRIKRVTANGGAGYVNGSLCKITAIRVN